MPSKYKIALDVMGGDYAPISTLEGAQRALDTHDDLFLYLVGDQDRILNDMKNLGLTRALAERTRIIHASDVVNMEDRATIILREKKDASVCVAAKLVADGLADGFVSIGHTGAAMVASMKLIGVLPGVVRPCLASSMPNMLGKPTLLLDVGANLECKPEHIVQFAVMGSIYAKDVFNIDNPKVGILNVGEEAGKGSANIKEATNFLSGLDLNFLGNAEGRDIWNGAFDIVVCDGFVGNAILKSSEGLAEGLANGLAAAFKETWFARLGGILAMSAIRRFSRKIDYSEYGGAPLLGINGIAIIGHGRSNARAIKNAIHTAVTASKHHINDHIKQSLTKMLYGTTFKSY